MPTLTNSALYYESGQSQQAAAEMTDSGDHTTYTLTAKPWSRVGSAAYSVKPYGLATGGAVTPAVSGSDNVVDVAALTAYMWGATGASATTGLLSVAADTDVSCTRATASDTHIINSITVDSSGAIAVVAGTDGTAFSETRGVAGGPPLIPVDSIEIAQVRLDSNSDAAITSAEIFSAVGSHQERYDFPVWSEDPLSGSITFSSALPTIHTGSVTKKIYARVATPVFAEIPRARNWVPAETSNSVSSEDYYDGAVGSFSSSIGQAAFEVSLGDGVSDNVLLQKGNNIIFKWSPDKDKTPYQLTQGVFGFARTNVPNATPKANCTVSAEIASKDFSS